MRLDLSTWQEVEAYLTRSTGIIIPTGSTEQHGPMGLIGTDAICAQTIAEHAATQADALVAPTLALTPAPFNMRFPGTISISEPLFEALAREIVEGLAGQGFRHIYFLNGHGANLAPLRRIAAAEVAITQATHRILPPGDAVEPPRKLTPEFIKAHAGDKQARRTNTAATSPTAASAPTQPWQDRSMARR